MVFSLRERQSDPVYWQKVTHLSSEPSRHTGSVISK